MKSSDSAWNERSYSALRSNGPMKPSKLTPEQRDEIKYLRYEGVDTKELAVRFGVTAGYIRSYFEPLERP